MPQPTISHRAKLLPICEITFNWFSKGLLCGTFSFLQITCWNEKLNAQNTGKTVLWAVRGFSAVRCGLRFTRHWYNIVCYGSPFDLFVSLFFESIFAFKGFLKKLNGIPGRNHLKHFDTACQNETGTNDIFCCFSHGGRCILSLQDTESIHRDVCASSTDQKK